MIFEIETRTLQNINTVIILIYLKYSEKNVGERLYI